MKMPGFALFLFLLSACPALPAAAQQAGLEVMPLGLTDLKGETHFFEVEVADTAERRRIGLMNRWELAADKGMLFVFPAKQVLHFWMKDTLIPLDMLFIDDAGRVVKVHASARPNDLTPVSSENEVAWALELPGGRAKELGITAGSMVTTPLPKPETAN